MKKLIVGVFLSVAMAMSMGCAEVVDTGHRGLLVEFGKVVSEAPLTEGLHWYNPFTQSVVEMDIRTQSSDFTTPAYTKDVQQAAIQLRVNYNLDPTAVKEIYTEVGHDWAQKLLPQVVEDTLKGVLGQYSAEGLISARDEAGYKIQSIIKERMADRKVIVSAVNLRNVDFRDEFERSIEAKVIAAQEAQAETNRTEKHNQLALQKERMAEAEAKAIREVGRALAQNKDLVALEFVKAWDGRLPVISGGSGQILNVDKVVEQFLPKEAKK